MWLFNFYEVTLVAVTSQSKFSHQTCTERHKEKSLRGIPEPQSSPQPCFMTAVETVTGFIFLGSKITVDGDYRNEIKRCCSFEERL